VCSLVQGECTHLARSTRTSSPNGSVPTRAPAPGAGARVRPPTAHSRPGPAR
jgi:hypothetical protein